MVQQTRSLATTRRDFVKVAGALVSTVALPESLSLFAFPGVANAQGIDPITSGLNVVSAFLSLMNQNDATAKEMAALNLKLDQVLKNQETIINAIGVLQDSIDRLPKEIAGIFISDHYNELWIDAGSLFDRTKRLIGRAQPLQEKLEDYNGIVEELYGDMSRADSRIQKTGAKQNGVASLRPASQAMILYIHTLYALATFESNLPINSRWKHGHVGKFVEMADYLTSALHSLVAERIPEALEEQETNKIAAYKAAQTQPWGAVFQKMVEGAYSPSRFISFRADTCFISQYMSQTWETVQADVKYQKYPVEMPMGSEFVFPNIDINVQSVIDTWLRYKDDVLTTGRSSFISAKSCTPIIRGGNPDRINRDTLISESNTFKADLASHAQAVINQRILYIISDGCRKLSAESLSFRRQISVRAQEAESDKSLFRKMMDLVLS
jgi:hypothetical protein